MTMVLIGGNNSSLNPDGVSNIIIRVDSDHGEVGRMEFEAEVLESYVFTGDSYSIKNGTSIDTLVFQLPIAATRMLLFSEEPNSDIYRWQVCEWDSDMQITAAETQWHADTVADGGDCWLISVSAGVTESKLEEMDFTYYSTYDSDSISKTTFSGEDSGNATLASFPVSLPAKTMHPFIYKNGAAENLLVSYPLVGYSAYAETATYTTRKLSLKVSNTGDRKYYVLFLEDQGGSSGGSGGNGSEDGFEKYTTEYFTTVL
jgi:hypothetical protein